LFCLRIHPEVREELYKGRKTEEICCVLDRMCAIKLKKYSSWYVGVLQCSPKDVGEDSNS
jgi:hypothetical protein